MKKASPSSMANNYCSFHCHTTGQSSELKVDESVLYSTVYNLHVDTVSLIA